MSKKTLEKDSSWHDWLHIERVWNMAIHIAEQEGHVDLFVVQLAALLHDIADHKFHGGDMRVGLRLAQEWLSSCGVDNDVIEKDTFIVGNISFNQGRNKVIMPTKEGEIVQDSDRLDPIGAIGIARVFACGAQLGNSIGDSVQHFYDKLLLLKDKMNTKTGRKIAE